MKNVFRAVAFLFLAQTVIFAEIPTSKPNEIVVDMKYHSEAKPISGNYAFLRPVPSYMLSSYNMSVDQYHFFEGIKKLHPKVEAYNIFPFDDSNFVFVDYNSGKVIAAYYDANHDGKVDKDDKLIKVKGTNKGSEFYIAPNYDFLTPDGKKIPFRFMIEVKFGKSKIDPIVNCYDCSCYKGKVIVEGKKYTLIFMPDIAPDSSYSYSEFGKSYYLIIPEGEKIRQRQGQILTTHIKINSQIYDVSSIEYSENGKDITVILTKNIKPLADFKINVQGLCPLKYELNEIYLLSAGNDTIKVRSTDSNKQIPEGKYKVLSANVFFGKDQTNEYSCFLGGTNYINVKKGQENSISVGRPKMKLYCFRNYVENVSMEDFISQKQIDITDYLNIFVFLKGIGNEGYGNFAKIEKGWKYYYPKLTVLNDSGKIIRTEKSWSLAKTNDAEKEYACFTWSPPRAGKYTIVVSMDTGPLGGVLEDRWEVTVVDQQQRMIVMCVSGGVLAVVLIILAFTWKKGFSRHLQK